MIANLSKSCYVVWLTQDDVYSDVKYIVRDILKLT